MSSKLEKMVLSALFLGLALVLPLLTGQIPQVGNMLCLIHIPIFLCGFLCGPFYGGLIGFITPYLRFLIFGMPPLIPKGISMSLELLTYGLVAGFLYSLLKDKKYRIYISLIIAMFSGRIVWGIARTFFYGVYQADFSFNIFIVSGFLTSIPGMILQLILIPILVKAVEKKTKIRN